MTMNASGAGSWTIREATRADLPALGRLGAQMVEAHYAFDRERFMHPAGIEDGYARFLGTQLSNPDAILLVAEVDGRVAGYVYAAVEAQSWQELRDEAGYIHDVVVDDPARGLGIGAALVDAAVAWLRDRGMLRVLLWTAALNTRARDLFARLGFRNTMVEMTRELTVKS
ncbi:MAG TPA: GNAT family N-acetyltransferase [Vicinamibacterales bacterium]|nr:GNAT family N-acetyltransferase [Vicinamibacterales bacterium]